MAKEMDLASFFIKSTISYQTLSWIHIVFYITLKLQNLIHLQILERNWKHFPWVPTIDSIIHAILSRYSLSVTTTLFNRLLNVIWTHNCRCTLWTALLRREHNWYWRSRILMSSCPVHIKQGSTSIKPFSLFFFPERAIPEFLYFFGATKLQDVQQFNQFRTR